MPDFNAIARKWQKRWEQKKIFKATEDPSKQKCYVLEMYPYPSASFLHMGHVRNYTIGDVYARFKRMNGYNVLYPMGYDSFGLPAEMAAKKEGIHPEKYTNEAISKIQEYQKGLGNSYDWDRVLSSHDPDYYKWNQHFFIKLFEKGLAYRNNAPVNWCQNCQSVLANEEAEGGKCWRCGGEVVKKDLEQWFLKITAYADRLLEDLDKVDWPERIKVMQRNWINRKEWIDIDYIIEGTDKHITVSTTRPDTNFGATFVVLAPEHPFLSKEANLVPANHRQAVDKYIQMSQKKTDEERIAEGMKKTGTFAGLYCINQLTKKRMPIWVTDFVLMTVGTGAVVGVPGHDTRDFEFAREFGLPVIRVVVGKDGDTSEITKKEQVQEEEGTMINSVFLNGLDIHQATKKVRDYLEEKKWGKRVIRYKIRDWLISRQRYWGTPIPMIHCKHCGIVPVPEKDLPVTLPKEADFKATNPIATNTEFLHVKCPSCKADARRETDTMGGFVDSSWYFLRYCDNKNKKEAFSKAKVKYWMPVDQYVGGAEHAVMHLMYARFFVKALKDLGIVDFDEPFARLFNQGIVYKDGAKMSKSKGNVVYQTEISNKYGIDTARIFLMSVAAPDSVIEWRDEGIEGSFRFLNRVFSLTEKKLVSEISPLTESKMNRTIKEIMYSIENFQYNKGMVKLMDYAHHLSMLETVPKTALRNLILLLSPFAPHVSEEMWEAIGEKGFASLAQWPLYDESGIDSAAEAAEENFERIIIDIRAVMELSKVKEPSSLKIIIGPRWKYALYSALKEEMEKTRDMSALIKAILAKPELKTYGGEASKIVNSALKDSSKIPKVVLTQDEDIESLKKSVERIRNYFSVDVTIETAENSSEEKARHALPGKPALIIQ